MRQHRLRRSLGHPTAMPSVLSGEKAAERSRLDPYEEWRRQRDPTYLATPLPVAATKNRSVGVLGIQVGDAITIGVDREATKRIQRNAIKRELGDPRFFEQRTEKAFNKFDVDGGGTIEADELQMTMDSLGLRLSDEEVAALVEKYDVDGDAQFDLEEFRTMVRDMIRDDTPEPGDEPREPVSLPTSP